MMRDEMKKWVTYIWIGLLLIYFGLPIHSVYGIEETADESVTENIVTEAGERDPDEAQGESPNTETTEDASPSDDSEKSISKEESRAELDSSEEYSISEQVGPNLFQNPSFTYDTINGGLIANWEMIGTTTPVNWLMRDLTLIGMEGSWIRTSDSRFFLGSSSLNNGTFWVSNQNNNGTMIIAQTVETVVGRTYQVSADFRSSVGTSSFFTMTAYRNVNVAGNTGLLNSSNFSMSSNIWATRTMQFTATSSHTTIGYRVASDETGSSQAGLRVPQIAAINRSLTLQASPAAGGMPKSDENSITPGDSTTITANPNIGYRFSHWETVSGGGELSNATSEISTFTMGNSDATVLAVYEQIPHSLNLEASPAEGGSPSANMDTLIDQEETEIHANPNSGYRFASWEILSGDGAIIADETAEKTTFTMGSSDVVLRANYYEEATDVRPVDPLNPEIEVDPENKPELPEDQGLLSIDFVSSFNFDTQVISVHDQMYFAKSQRLLNEDGTVNETEERPNYIQISDRRAESERNGWQLSVTQTTPFIGEEGQILTGAQLGLKNQELISAQTNATHPMLVVSSHISLTPGNKRPLIHAQGTEGVGTWIYRFGDQQSAQESVTLSVPGATNPDATKYETTLEWELGAVPGN